MSPADYLCVNAVVFDVAVTLSKRFNPDNHLLLKRKQGNGYFDCVENAF